MIWLIFTLLSVNTIKDIDHKTFKTYNDCQLYIEQLKSDKPKSCFTSYAQFKQPKKVKYEPNRNVRHNTPRSK